MGKMQTTNVQENEIIKASDVNKGFDAQITNVAKAFQCIFENNQDFIVSNNEVLSYHSMEENDWSLILSPIYGVCKSTGVPFLDTDIQLISIDPPTDGNARRDIIEVQGYFLETDKQKRSFLDFDTKAISIAAVHVQKELNVSCRAKKAEIEGSVQPPVHSDGWVKIAEIFIPGDATRISDCTIYNIDADIIDKDNTGWDIEKKSTYNVGYISSVNKKFRVDHNVDGSHKDASIHNNNLDIGNGDNQINGQSFPISEEITVADTSYSNTTDITSLMVALASQINTLYNNYIKYGAFNLNGELALSSLLSDNKLANAVKLGASGDGSAYIKIGSKEVLKITQSGTTFAITTGTGYTASNNADLVTKADLNTKQNTLTFDSAPTENSNNPVTSDGIKKALNKIEGDAFSGDYRDLSNKPDYSAKGGPDIAISGTPSVSVSEENNIITFTFNNLKGEKGDKGDNGRSCTLSIGTVATVPDTASASASITEGTTTDYLLNLSIPKGSKGDIGNTCNLSIGTVTTSASGGNAEATITGTSPNYVLNLTLPRGSKGDKGDKSTFAIGTVTTGNAGTSASASITAGTTTDYLLNLTIPKGDKGDGSDDKMSKSNPVGTGSFSMNRKADTTVGFYSFAEGSNCTASESYSHAEGNNTTASAGYAHAEGYNSIASGQIAHAEGSGTKATANYSHAEGRQTEANATHSHAEGLFSKTAGMYAHAEGNSTEANGEASHSEGLSTIAEGANQHVAGKYNVSDTTSARITGWGTNLTDRKNIEQLGSDGTLRLKGDVYVGCNDDSTGGTKLTSIVYYGTCSTVIATNAKVVTCDGFKLETGARIAVKFTDTSTTAPTSGYITLNVNSTGAKNVYYKNNTRMTYSHYFEFRGNKIFEFVYDGTNFVWLNYDTDTIYATITQAEIDAGTATSARVVTPKLLKDNFAPKNWDSVPIGTVIAFAGSAPTGYLLCNGQAVSRTTYADLYAVIGTKYGAGNGSTTFNVPNLVEKFPMGANGTLGTSGGEATVTLQVEQLPKHTHNTNSYQLGYPQYHTGDDEYITLVNNKNVSHDEASSYGYAQTTEAGANKPHNNLPPYQTVNYCIKALNASGGISTNAVLDDTVVSANKLWSSNKINSVINNKLTSGYKSFIVKITYTTATTATVESPVAIKIMSYGYKDAEADIWTLVITDTSVPANTKTTVTNYGGRQYGNYSLVTFYVQTSDGKAHIGNATFATSVLGIGHVLYCQCIIPE